MSDIVGTIKGQTLNLVLVGMPGCGKSSLGAMLAESMGRKLIDCDTEIVRRAGMTIPEIFEKFGEAHFRDIESQILREVCSGSASIIATGGGAILRNENVQAMRQNGRVCFIRRDIDLLPRNGRPLSSASEDAVARLWAQRKELYHTAADYIADNDDTLEVVCKRIEEGFHEAARH